MSNDYALLVWGLNRVNDPGQLLDGHGLEEGLDSWLAGNAVMKRTFRSVATIAGLVERTLPGKRKTGRQITFSTDIIYDTLRKYDPDHILLKITREEAMRGLVDFARIRELIERVGNRIEHARVERITPLAAPLLLEVGSIPIRGKAEEILLEQITNQSGGLSMPVQVEPDA